MNLNHRLPRIVAKPDLLSEEFLPSYFHARQRQLQELKTCLAPALRRQKPIHVWLHGQPGTGKTTVARQVLEEVNGSGIKGALLNCRRRNSFYSILDGLLEKLRVLCAEERSTNYKFTALEKHIGDKPLVVVLDEIDQMPLKERTNTLHGLSTLGNVGLVCIGMDKLDICSMNNCVDSRLNVQMIDFPQFSQEDVVNILNDRARYSLKPDSWNVKCLEHIAGLAQGDARIAIQTLRSAANFAESDYIGFIEERHIEKGYGSTRDLKKFYVLKTLTEHHQLLFEIIKKKGKIISSDLRREYKEECRIKDWEPVAPRTFSEYCRQLMLYRLIDGKRARVRGKVFEFGICD